ncbi:hypothetical protein GCM10011371_14760 [Novosphingobium marinum]|uniref:Uncharacterized protein involved in cysteine biosynthesis n=1 Tax=Novosphingobium marinum TaxID=1514948 RepID=A0A7Y9XW67_9SPHN|nr:EI24 domain-containing protein [Novosphingobium marinum]NYH95590.1 uncharacterized protein involved in cysteine biosynthesis [Novosphingobium marinum]GGC28266.1 hypothetical protein GCM10011371_14760 [Novosphingobium marinum]
MLHAFALALGQLADPRVLRILLKCVVVTLLLFAAIGTVAWYGLDALFATGGLTDTAFAGAGGVRGIAAVILVVIGGWLLWRILALAVLQFYADEVVLAVEARHYPHAMANARTLGWREELANGLRGAIRALAVNLLVLPVALLLLVTGVGTAILFWLVNAVLLGRELTEMVWQRHRHDPAEGLPLSRLERFVMGGIVAGLLIVPVANLLAPVLGAAMAAHLFHRKKVPAHAP